MAHETRNDYEERGGIPRWLKIVGLIALVVVALAVIIMVAGGGNHGPQRHGGLGAGATSALGQAAR